MPSNAEECPACHERAVFTSDRGRRVRRCGLCGWSDYEPDTLEETELPVTDGRKSRKSVARHLDLFVADMLDVAPKDTRQQLEFPLFSISKKPDLAVRRYEDKKRGIFLEVTPSVKGLATIHDKDVLIFLASQIVAGINAGRKPGQTVEFTSHDLLVSTNRGTGGASYDRLTAALERLRGTSLRTNIKTGKAGGGTRRSAGFGLIDNWEVAESTPDDARTMAVRVKLSDWFYRAVTNLEVLTLDRDYFRLKSPLDRALYELARKHCGDQPFVRMGIETLWQKTGSRSKLWKFRQLLTKAISSNDLPTYTMRIDPNKADVVIFEHRDTLPASQ